MASITLKGNAIETIGELPQVGQEAPGFCLTGIDLADKKLSDFQGKKIVLNIFPSIDTPICSASVRRFNQAAAGKDDVVVLCISKDLPFAHKRFCGAEGVEDVVSLSELRDSQFGKDYGVQITTGPMAGLLSRAVVVVGADGKIAYTQQVPEIVDEPDYDSALAALS